MHRISFFAFHTLDLLFDIFEFTFLNFMQSFLSFSFFFFFDFSYLFTNLNLIIKILLLLSLGFNKILLIRMHKFVLFLSDLFDCFFIIQLHSANKIHFIFRKLILNLSFPFKLLHLITIFHQMCWKYPNCFKSLILRYLLSVKHFQIWEVFQNTRFIVRIQRSRIPFER